MSLSLITLAPTLRNILLNDSSSQIKHNITTACSVHIPTILYAAIDLRYTWNDSPSSGIHKIPNYYIHVLGPKYE